MTIAEAVMEAWIRSSVGLALAIAAVLVLRKVVGSALGPRAVRFFWLSVPLSVFAAWLPAWIEPSPTANGTSMLQGAVAAVAVEVGATAATPWWAWGFSAWLVGALALGLLLWQRQRRFEARISSTADGSERRLPRGESPVAIGAWRPRIVLPRDFESRFTADEQALILAHEQVHMRRHDGVWSLLASIVLCVQWFNPMAWIAMRAFRDDLERACDAEVMRQHPRSAKAYASALLKQVQGPWAPLASAWGSRHPVVGRIAAIGDHRRLQRFDRFRLGSAFVLCACVVAVAHAAAPRGIDVGAAQSDGSRRFVRMAFELLSGDTVVAQPVVVVREGEAASVSVDGPDGFELEAAARDLGAERIGVTLRFAPRPGDALASIGEQTVLAGGPPAVFEAAAADLARAAIRVQMVAAWMTSAEVEALRDAPQTPAMPPQEPVLDDAPTPFPPGLATVPNRALTVVLRVRVSADGMATDAAVDQFNVELGEYTQAERAQFETAAMAAVRDWRFQPARSAQGVPEERWVLVPVRYSTRSSDTPPG